MKSWVIAVWSLLAAGLPQPGHTHAMPNSTVVIEDSPPGTVDLTLAIPISELEAAAPGRIADDRIENFVQQHVSVRGVDQRAWLGTLTRVVREGGDHPLIKLALRFTLAEGAAQTAGKLQYDAVIDRIASHYVLVYRRAGGELRPLVRLQAPDTTVDLADRP